MRALIQRVSEARVSVDEAIVGEIGMGLLIFLGVEEQDEQEDVEWLARKVAALRIFSDAEGKMNRDIGQARGAVLCVSQFTLHASTRKGNRPSFVRAASPNKAEALYRSFMTTLREKGTPVEEGVFGAHMCVHLINDGPVTIWMDSRNKE